MLREVAERMPGSSARQSGRLVIGCIGISLMICMCIAANFASIGEPYPTWGHYFGVWVTISAVLTGMLSAGLIVGFCVPCAVEGLRTNRADAFIGATLVAWRIMPFALIWSSARLIDASYAPSFDGPLSTGRLPGGYKPIAAIFGNPVIGFVFPFVCIYMGSVKADQIRRARNEPRHLCPHCGYSTLGLPTDTCPECGRSTHITPPS